MQATLEGLRSARESSANTSAWQTQALRGTRAGAQCRIIPAEIPQTLGSRRLKAKFKVPARWQTSILPGNGIPGLRRRKPEHTGRLLPECKPNTETRGLARILIGLPQCSPPSLMICACAKCGAETSKPNLYTTLGGGMSLS